MSATATLFAALAGAGLTLTGWVGYFRARFRSREEKSARWRKRRSVALVVAGFLVAFNADVAGRLVSPDASSGSGEAMAVFGTVALVVYRLLVISGMVVVAASMFLSSEFVTSRVRRTVRGVAAGMPGAARSAGQRVRSMTYADPVAVAREWQALLARDKELTRDFLRYDRDLEAAISFPVMRDYRDPKTSAALAAMLRCDEVRTPAPPPGTTDVRTTAYGRAVTEFGVAMAAAEDNAKRLVWSNFADDERKALDTAYKLLAFVRDHSTTPDERDVAYRRVVAELAKIPRDKFALADDALRRAISGPGDPEDRDGRIGPGAIAATSALDLDAVTPARVTPVRAHPWLDVEQRAR